MLFASLFQKKSQPVPFSPDIPPDERPLLLAELTACANRSGGSLKNARRAQALADLFRGLSPAGKKVFADTLGTLNDAASRTSGEQYSEIEEAEFFGGSESKLALLDMFETPRRRILHHLSGTSSGLKILGEISTLSEVDVQKDIDEVKDASS
ncbi:MAG TPA: hypothetical protein DEV64_03690 [Rhodospirillaceae bacterium]|nr:hypothetical protein [Rhodospirillaceae bacterium]|tara:strand:- start:4091 stop:4549 length:459 start_codon:yes stop_codon:yes gene_type:complete